MLQGGMEWVGKWNQAYPIGAAILATLEADFFLTVGKPIGNNEAFLPPSFQVSGLSRRYEYPWVMLNLQSGTRLLEAGGGESPLQLFFSDHYKEIYNVDMDEEAINKLKEKLEITKKIGKYQNIKPIYGDLLNMIYPEDYFDSTICISVLEHVKKDKILELLEKLLKITKKRLLITCDVSFQKGENPDSFDTKMLSKVLKRLNIEEPKLENPKEKTQFFLPEQRNNQKVMHEFSVALIRVDL